MPSPLESKKEKLLHSKREKLLILLAELRHSTGMERATQFKWFTEHSSSGENCGYARKAINSFYTKGHFEEVGSLIQNIVILMNEVENAGRQK